MKKEYSQDQIERILQSDAKIPDSVDKRIQDTYIKLGLTDNQSADKQAGERPAGRRKVHRKKRRVWVAVAAAAALTAGLGVTAFAVGQLLNVDLISDNGLFYSLSVDTSAKEAHEIVVSPTYVPDGYEYSEEGTYAGKWHNDSTNGDLNILTYNAADLYLMSETEDYPLHAPFEESTPLKTLEIQGMSVDLFTPDNIYSDDPSKRQDAFLFNEEHGYAVHIYLQGTDLPDSEAIKVAEGLNIEVLDSTVPYPSDEEIARIKQEQQERAEAFDSSFDDSLFYQVGDTMTDPMGIEEYSFQYKVTDIQLTDTLPLDQYPKENYVSDYDTSVEPLLAEDGTMKPHERYPYVNGMIDQDNPESVHSKFLVVTTETSNTGDGSTDMEAFLPPTLELLRKNSDGALEKYEYEPVSMDYLQLTVDGFPFYQTVQEFTENQKKHVRFAEITPGETLECTFVYLIDEDCVDDAYLAFFAHYGGMTNSYPRVKVTE